MGGCPICPRVVAIDIETTGLSYRQDRIVEICAVPIYGNQVALEGKFHVLIDPGKPIPADATVIHGITNEMVRGKPKLNQVLPYFLRYIADDPIVVQNAKFDVLFIDEAVRRTGLRWRRKNEVHDTMEMSRQLFPWARSHKLADICRRSGVTHVSQHRAEGDAAATAQAFVNMRSMIEPDYVDIVVPPKGRKKILPSHIPTQPLKNPGVAAVLSFFFMGLGQIYNGQILKGVLFIILYIISIALIFVGIGLITTPILWIIGMVDAHKSAQRINLEITGQAPPPAKGKSSQEAARQIPSPKQASQRSIRIKGASAYIRENRDPRSKVVARLGPRDRLRLLETTGRWSRVATANGKEGWIENSSIAKS